MKTVLRACSVCKHVTIQVVGKKQTYYCPGCGTTTRVTIGPQEQVVAPK